MKFQGIVQKGLGEAGAVYEMPTANIVIEHAPEGVFVGKVEMAGIQHPALICIRSLRQHGDAQILEAHILHFSGDLYGTQISVSLDKKIRDLIPFENRESMKILMHEDLQWAQAFFTPSP